jgi:hypothetical protein
MVLFVHNVVINMHISLNHDCSFNAKIVDIKF